MFDWDKAVMTIARYLATDKGKNEYRNLYKAAQSSWGGEYDLTPTEIKATARADAFVSLVNNLSIDDQQLDKDLCTCDWIDSRIWARSNNPEKIAEGLTRFIRKQ